MTDHIKESSIGKLTKYIDDSGKDLHSQYSKRIDMRKSGKVDGHEMDKAAHAITKREKGLGLAARAIHRKIGNASIKEDAPTNSAGGGGIAGIGIGKMGEPGVSVKAQRKHNKDKSTPTPVILSMLRRKAPNPLAENKVYAIATRTRKGGLRRVPDTRFDSEISAKNYGDKYHRGKDGARYYEVVEHPDSKKKLKEDCDMFAGAIVFEVSSATFHNAKVEKRKGKHWRTYLDECDELAEIREYANKHRNKPIVLKNRTTSEMVYVRYGKGK